MLSSSDSVVLVCDGEEHGISVDILIVGDEGSRGCVVCMVPFSDTRLWEDSTTSGDGPEKGLEWVLDGPERGYKLGWMVLCRGSGIVVGCIVRM